jgi:hypothetical protein
MRAVDHTTWLIIQDRIDELVFHIELAPLADLAQILAETIDQLEEHGWMIEGAPSLTGFFCNRDGERWFVHIVHYDPIRRARHGRSSCAASRAHSMESSRCSSRRFTQRAAPAID